MKDAFAIFALLFVLAFFVYRSLFVDQCRDASSLYLSDDCKPEIDWSVVR